MRWGALLANNPVAWGGFASVGIVSTSGHRDPVAVSLSRASQMPDPTPVIARRSHTANNPFAARMLDRIFAERRLQKGPRESSFATRPQHRGINAGQLLIAELTTSGRGRRVTGPVDSFGRC
jgi:hypothetical protein